MERDRETVGLTSETAKLLDHLLGMGWFPDAQDAARFCMAYAIRARVPEGATVGTETRWAAGNFDKAGEITALVTNLYPTCRTPVRLIEHLVNEGIRMVSDRLRSEEVGPGELME